MICRNPILEEECPHCVSWGSLPGRSSREAKAEFRNWGGETVFLRNDLKQ